MLLHKLDEPQSTNHIRAVLGIHGDSATIEHHMGSDQKPLGVRWPYREVVVRTPQNEFRITKYGKDQFFIGKIPTGGIAEYIQVSDSHIAIAGNPLRATLPHAWLLKLASLVVGKPPEPMPVVEIIDRNEQTELSQKIYNKAAEVMGVIFNEIDWRARAVCMPAKAETPIRFEHNQASEVFTALGFKDATGWSENPPHILYTSNEDCFVVKVIGPTYGKHEPESFSVTQQLGGVARIEWRKPGDKSAKLVFRPVQFSQRQDFEKADVLFTHGPLRPGATANDIRLAAAFGVNEVSRLLYPLQIEVSRPEPQ